MMIPLMQKMAAPLPLASALCHVATIAVMMNMHIQLSTVQDTATGPHRTLLDSDGDSLVTVAHMTKAVDHLQDTLGSRLTAVERENTEPKVSVNALKDAQAGTEHGSRAGSDDGALDDQQIARTQRFHNTTVEHDQLQVRPLTLRVDELQATVQSLAEGQRRGLQGAEPEPEPEIGENVKIIKPQVVRCGGPGGTTSDGTTHSGHVMPRVSSSGSQSACPASVAFALSSWYAAQPSSSSSIVVAISPLSPWNQRAPVRPFRPHLRRWCHHL